MDFANLLTGIAPLLTFILLARTASETTVGQANPQGYASGSYWDLYWRDTDVSSPSQFDANTIVHEIGHALGLSHPYEDPHNGKFNIDDTVMSHNISPDGWDTWFSDNDLVALIAIWGAEDDHSKSVPPKDFITGEVGGKNYFGSAKMHL